MGVGIVGNTDIEYYVTLQHHLFSHTAVIVFRAMVTAAPQRRTVTPPPTHVVRLSYVFFCLFFN